MTIFIPSPEYIDQMATKIRLGEVVGFPTETVYGLGCDTFNADAVKKVYALKGRPANNPTIAHIHNLSIIKKLTPGWNSVCARLAEHFWPGPLTLVLPKHNSVPLVACGGLETIAIRIPSHPVALKLLQEFGGPISAPSANPSGYISPTNASHVEQSFLGSIAILDGGQCDKGIESTVLSMIEQPTILRPGSITKENLLAVIDGVVELDSVEQRESPGTSRTHYAPKTRAIMLGHKDISDSQNPEAAYIVINSKPNVFKNIIVMPNNPEQYAEQIYSALREADKCQAREILIESPPPKQEWRAILDRLHRATSI